MCNPTSQSYIQEPIPPTNVFLDISARAPAQDGESSVFAGDPELLLQVVVAISLYLHALTK
jgi:hypothetical protein